MMRRRNGGHVHAPGSLRAAGISAMVLGVLLVPIAIAITVNQHAHTASAVDRSLHEAAEQATDGLEGYLQRASTINLLAAQNPAFSGLYDPATARSARRKVLLSQANDALSYMSSLFARSISEACTIHRSGVEVARAVRGVTSLAEHLSPDESKNPFFAGSFKVPIGEVYQSKPYVSPDTGEWVIGNATPIAASGSRKAALVHFELTIASFHRLAVTNEVGVETYVIDARTGRVIIDSEHNQMKGAPLGRPSDRRFASLVGRGTGSGFLDLGTSRVAFERLQASAANANDWYVVATLPAPSGLFGTIGPSQWVLIGVALLLVGAGGVSYRQSKRAEEHHIDSLEDELFRRVRSEQALRDALGREHAASNELRKLDEMKMGFLRAVSHELRTPLTAILGFAHILEDADSGAADASDAEKAASLERLVRNAEKLERLLSNLLDLDRIDRGVASVERRNTDMGSLVRRVVEELSGQRGVYIDVDDVEALVDAPKIERIIENLLSNAMKHTSADVTIWVRVEALTGGMLITVDDDGPGIPDELKASIFDPFTQGASAASASQGTGIGLSLVADFAEMHGGSIWVQDREGGGASFRVFIPDPSKTGEASPADGGGDDIGRRASA